MRRACLIGILVLAACGGSKAPADKGTTPEQPAAAAAAATATAELKDAKGASVGSATLTEDTGGVKVAIEVSGLKPGKHGFHIHAVGKCEAPDFKSAGGHFNPHNKKHGKGNPDGKHGGDLPNLEVGADGKGTIEYMATDISLGEGPGSLFGSEGTALVIHADQDDEKTDPAGNAGARVVCGVITRSAG